MNAERPRFLEDTIPRWRIVLTLCFCAVFVIGRKPDRLLHPQFFVEDGMFFTDAYERGLDSFVLPYAGYLHAVPRLFAWTTSYVEPSWLPAIYNLAALVLILGVAAAIFSPRIKLPAKPLLALSVALAPHTGEIHFHFTNIQWILALGLVLILIAEDGISLGQRARDIAATALIGLTGPFTCLFLPLFVIRWWQRRSAASREIALVAAATAATQIATFILYRNSPVPSAPDTYWTLCALSGRTFGTFCLGYDIEQIRPRGLWPLLGLGGCAGVVWIAAVNARYRKIHLTFLAAAVLVCAATGFKFLRETPALSIAKDGDRYFFIPHVLLTWILVIWFFTACSIVQRAIAGVILAMALLSSLGVYRGEPYQRLDWAEHVAPIRKGGAYSIPINPEGMVISSEGRNSRR